MINLIGEKMFCSVFSGVSILTINQKSIEIASGSRPFGGNVDAWVLFVLYTNRYLKLLLANASLEKLLNSFSALILPQKYVKTAEFVDPPPNLSWIFTS